MYELGYESYFCASHQMPENHGGLGPLHGHNWCFEVCVQGTVLNSIGMLMDFKELKALVKQLVDENLDHKHLNDCNAFKGIAPDAEGVAKWLGDRLAILLPDTVSLSRVTVEAVACCKGVYSPDICVESESR